MSTDLEMTGTTTTSLAQVLRGASREFARLIGATDGPEILVANFSSDLDGIVGDPHAGPVPPDLVLPTRVEGLVVGGEAPPAYVELAMAHDGLVSLSTWPSWAWGASILLTTGNHAPATYVLLAAVALTLMRHHGAVLEHASPYTDRAPVTADSLFEDIRALSPVGDFEADVQQVVGRSIFRARPSGRQGTGGDQPPGGSHRVTVIHVGDGVKGRTERRH